MADGSVWSSVSDQPVTRSGAAVNELRRFGAFLPHVRLIENTDALRWREPSCIGHVTVKWR
jgi:hypothetical protein